MSEKIRERCEIPLEDTWAIEDLYATDEAWEQELAALEDDKKVIVSYKKSSACYNLRKF